MGIQDQFLAAQDDVLFAGNLDEGAVDALIDQDAEQLSSEDDKERF